MKTIITIIFLLFATERGGHYDLTAAQFKKYQRDVYRLGYYKGLRAAYFGTPDFTKDSLEFEKILQVIK